MSEALSVPKDERGLVRVFTLEMRPEEARFLRQPEAAAAALGVAEIDPSYVEVFPLSDLQDLGLPGYLTEGCGVPETEITENRDQLEGLDGWVMVVLSRAFGGRAETLIPKPGIVPVAIHHVEQTNWEAPPMAVPESAKPYSAPVRNSASSPRAARDRARRIGGTIFAVFMVLIAIMIAWVVL